MKKLFAVFLAATLLPLTTFAYSVSGGYHSYSVPIRSYTPSYHYTAPSYHYTPPPPPVRTYTVPTRTYTQTVNTPTKAGTNTYIPTTRTVYVPSSPVVYYNYQYWNPFGGNWFLWYWLFSSNNHNVTNNYAATSTSH